MMNNRKILIIVPAYNEEKSIGSTLEKLVEFKEGGYYFDVCVVNDGSTDRTNEIVNKFNVTLINLPYNMGIGSCMQTGYKYAYYNNYDIAVQLDADGQHDEKQLINLIEPILNDDCDMVIGSRFINNIGFQSSVLRRFGIKFFTRLLYIITRKKITDPTSGFRAKNRAVISCFANEYPKDYPEPEVIVCMVKNDLKIKEIPVVMKDKVGNHQ